MRKTGIGKTPATAIAHAGCDNNPSPGGA